MQPAEWSALAAWTALVIGLVNLWYGVVRPWWRSREASPSAEMDLFHYRGRAGEWKEEIRIVIRNHGPARMTEAEVDLLDVSGDSMTSGPDQITALWPPMPIERLHAGQSIYLTLSPSISTPTPNAATVRWRDGRKEMQSRKIPLSYHRIF